MSLLCKCEWYIWWWEHVPEKCHARHKTTKLQYGLSKVNCFKCFNKLILSWFFSSSRIGRSLRETMSDEYRGWCIIMVFWGENSQESSELWTGALSWRNCHWLFYQKFRHFLLFASCKQCRTSTYNSLLNVWPNGKNMWYDMTLEKQWAEPSYLIKLDKFYSVLALWEASSETLGFSFNIISIYPCFIISYCPFEQLWIIIDFIQQLLSNVHLALLLVKIQVLSNVG